MSVIKKTFIASVLFVSGSAFAQDNKVLNLYSSRHYQTDEALYSNFTKATGIKVNRIEAGDDQLVERLRGEGVASGLGGRWPPHREGYQPADDREVSGLVPTHAGDTRGRRYWCSCSRSGLGACYPCWSCCVHGTSDR